ncbi:MAG: choice-of-anchor D domain-containing protein [Desulfobacterales bacterium]|nr:choice-of-anchor D domain-containing protein [Desulfobacterales bacterium]
MRVATFCSNRTGQVYFKRSGSGSVYSGGSKTLSAGRSWGVYEFDMSGNSNWRGTITELRFDPSSSCGSSGSSGFIGVDWIEVVAGPAPDISTDRTSINEPIQAGNYVVKTIRVYNRGAGVLNVTNFRAYHDSPSSPSWIGNFSPSSMTVSANSNRTFTFNINAVNLPAGSRRGRVVISSNDPDTPSKTISVNLSVSPPPEPNISTDQTTINEPIQAGNYVVKTIRVYNRGDASLSVSGFRAYHDSPSSPSWIGNFNPSSMTVSANSSRTFTFNINAVNLPSGSRRGRVVISSNDPDTPSKTITVNLSVSPPPAPDITLSPPSIPETIRSGDYVVKTIRVDNTGNATLNITGFTAHHDNPSTPSWIGNFNPSTLSVAAGSSKTFAFNINAVNLPAGARTGRVTVHSNDPDAPSKTLNVNLSVTPGAAPDISLAPPAVDEALPIGKYVVKTIRVDNAGDAVLEITGFTAHHDSPAAPPWIGNFNPSSMSVAAGSSKTFAFNINALNLLEGARTGRVVVHSNDPDAPAFTLNVQLTVSRAVFDLGITLAPIPTNAQRGAGVPITCAVSRSGDALHPSDGRVRVYIYMNQDPDPGNISPSDLILGDAGSDSFDFAAGELDDGSETKSTTITAPAKDGPFYIHAKVDGPNEWSDESDKSNNVASSAATMAIWRSGAPPADEPAGVLARTWSDSKVFWIKYGKKWPLLSREVFDGLGFTDAGVGWYGPGALDGLAAGKEIMKDNDEFCYSGSDSSTVYIIECGESHPFFHWRNFQGRGFGHEDVFRASPEGVDWIQDATRYPAKDAPMMRVESNGLSD